MYKKISLQMHLNDNHSQRFHCSKYRLSLNHAPLALVGKLKWIMYLIDTRRMLLKRESSDLSWILTYFLENLSKCASQCDFPFRKNLVTCLRSM